MKIISKQLKILGLIVALTGLLTNMACAVDNPDSPDLIAGFKERVKVHAAAVDDPKLTNRGILIAYDDYRIVLDKELNKAYKLLMSKLPKAQQQELKTAQQNWLKYRDAEYAFIQDNWTRDNFGSSAGRSRGAYRCSIIEDRVIQLLNYAQNY